MTVSASVPVINCKELPPAYRAAPILTYQAYLTEEFDKIAVDYGSWTLYPPPQKSIDFHKSTKQKYIIGANKQNKSFTCLCETAMLAGGIHPWKPTRIPNNGYIATVNDKKIREWFIPELTKILGKWYTGIDKRDNCVTLPVGSKIYLMSYSADDQSFAASALSYINWDEEPQEKKWKEGRRAIGANNRLSIFGGMTQIELANGTPEYQYLYNLLINPPAHVDIFTGETRDNPAITEEEILDMEKDYSGTELALRVYGIHGTLVGSPRFDNIILSGILKELSKRQPLFQYGESCIDIYEDRKDGEEYMVIADGAKGREGENSSITVTERYHNKQVAQWSGKIEPEILARYMIEVGKYYNRALLIPENNEGGGGGTTVYVLKQEKYPHVYFDRKLKQLGFNTNRHSRPEIVQFFATAIRCGKVHFCAADTVRQCITFIRDKGTSRGTDNCHAQGGCEDHEVLTMMIGHFINITQPYYKKTVTVAERIEVVTINQTEYRRTDYENEEGEVVGSPIDWYGIDRMNGKEPEADEDDDE